MGDFVLKRADGLFAYQLAVVVDDAEQGITDVVRGSDLLGVTPQQIVFTTLFKTCLRQGMRICLLLSMSQEINSSKRHGAVDMTQGMREQTLWQAFDFLGLSPPDDLLNADLNSLWHWAFVVWEMVKVPNSMALPYDNHLSK